MTDDAPQVAVVGGGVVGTSVLYHLAERHGVTDAVLFEQGQLAGGSTSRAVGGVRYTFGHLLNVELGKCSIEFFENFGSNVGVDVENNPYLFTFHSEANERAWRERHEQYLDCGMAPELLTADEVTERYPLLDPSAFRGAMLAPECVRVDPFSVTQAYATAAREAGAEIRTNEGVEDVVTEDGAVTAVETAEGSYDVDYVVNAAGSFSGRVAGMVGVDLPIDLLVRRIVVTDPIDDEVPLVIDTERDFYFEMEANGSLLVCDTEADIHDADDPTTAVGDIGYDYYLGALEKLEQMAPGVGDLAVINDWAGFQTHTPDGHALVGPTTVDGFLVATGMSGHGVMQSPWVGAAVADLVVRGSTDVFDVDLLRPDRFDRVAGERIDPEPVP